MPGRSLAACASVEKEGREEGEQDEVPHPTSELHSSRKLWKKGSQGGPSEAWRIRLRVSLQVTRIAGARAPHSSGAANRSS